MLQYPKEYNLLNEEELEYTGGGSDTDFMLALAAGGLAGVIVSSVVYILNGENIRNRKKAENPEKYLPDTDAAKRKLLADDSKEELMTSPLGAISLAGFAVSGVCIAVGAGISIANMFDGLKKQ